MKRFKLDWLVYLIASIALVVVGILMLPPVSVIKTDKIISAVIGVCLVFYLIFSVLTNVNKFKSRSFEVKLIFALEVLLVVYLCAASFLLIFDISIIGSNNFVNQIGRIIGGVLWMRGLVIVVKEVGNRTTQKFGKLLVYLGVLLISCGVYCFFNVNVSIKTITWIISIAFIVLAVVGFYLTITCWPKGKKK